MFSIDLLNPKFKAQYEDNPEQHFAWTMNYLKESAMSTSIEDISNSDFPAFILSGTDTNESTGTGTGVFDHRLIPIGDKQYLEIKIRRKDGKGVAAMISDPSLPFFTPEQRHNIIENHEWARSEEPLEGASLGTLAPGGIVMCYYEDGATRNSNFSGLRFRPPAASAIFDQFLAMSTGTSGLSGLFSGAMSMLGFGGGNFPKTMTERSKPPDSITLHYNVGHKTGNPQSVYDNMIKRNVAYHVLIAGNGNSINPVPYDKYVIHGHAGNSGVGVCFLNMGWGGDEYQQSGHARKNKALAGNLPGGDKWKPGKHPHKSKYWIWDPFTTQQINRGVQVCAEICKNYKLDPISDIQPHSHWSKKKQDVGPLFPLADFKNKVKQAMGG
jgi:hypothetical protein